MAAIPHTIATRTFNSLLVVPNLTYIHHERVMLTCTAADMFLVLDNTTNAKEPNIVSPPEDMISNK